MMNFDLVKDILNDDTDAVVDVINHQAILPRRDTRSNNAYQLLEALVDRVKTRLTHINQDIRNARTQRTVDKELLNRLKDQRRENSRLQNRLTVCMAKSFTSNPKTGYTAITPIEEIEALTQQATLDYTALAHA